MEDKKIIWLHQNYAKLGIYAGQYIAHDEKGIIAHSPHLNQVLDKAKKSKREFAIFFVPEHFEWTQIMTLRLLPVNKNVWKPYYSMTLHTVNNTLQTEMLVDSGADISVISFDVGLALGLQTTEGEIFLSASGIGGIIYYALRQISFTIDNYTFDAPVAWVQNQYTKDMILGREVVFDMFNIEFKQADKEIIFKRRSEIL